MTSLYLEHSEDDSKQYHNRHTACYCHGSDSGKWHGLAWMNVSHGISMNCSHTAFATLFHSCGNPTFPSWWRVLALSWKYEVQLLLLILYTTADYLIFYYFVQWPTNAQLIDKLLRCFYIFWHYCVILRGAHS